MNNKENAVNHEINPYLHYIYMDIYLSPYLFLNNDAKVERGGCNV